MGFLSFPHPKGDTNLTWEASSQISVLFSELLPHTESQLRTDPSEAEGAATQQDSFSLCVCVCVFANHTSSMTWFTNWLAQQRGKDHCSRGENPPDPVESGEALAPSLRYWVAREKIVSFYA